MAQGYIQEIKLKDTSAGQMTDFIIDGKRIGAGKFPPKGFKAGDYVNYEVEQKGNFLNLAKNSMSNATPPAGSSAQTAPAKSVGGIYGGFDERQSIISRQAAANTTLQWLQLLASQDALPIPKTGKDKKADLLQDMFVEYVNYFHRLATGNDFAFPEPSVKDLAAEENDTAWNEE